MEDFYSDIYEEIVIKEEPLFSNSYSEENCPSVVPKGNPKVPVPSDFPTPFEVQLCDAIDSNTLHIRICRICMKTELLQPIFKGEPPMPGKYDTAAKIMFVCPTIRKVKEDDGYPQFICLPCINHLDVTFNFLQTAVESDRRTSQFNPRPNGMTADERLQSPENTTRKCFRHKLYMAKDLVTGKIHYSQKSKRERLIQRMAHQKTVYATKDLPQKNINTNPTLKSRRWLSDYRKRRHSQLSSVNETTNAPSLDQELLQPVVRLNINNALYCLNCKTQALSGVCAKCGPIKLKPVVMLHVNNILYCLNCNSQTRSGVCRKCGPIKVKLLPCRACKKNYRHPIKNDQPSFVCLPCRKEFMAMAYSTKN